MADADEVPEALSSEVLVSIRIDEEARAFIRIDPVTGQLDLPLSVIRSLSDWLRRYDLRPSKRPPSWSNGGRPR